MLNLVGLALMLFTLVLLLAPGVFHQLVEKGLGHHACPPLRDSHY